VPLARLADLHPDIDNAGRKAMAAAVDHGLGLWRGLGAAPGDHAPLDEQPAGRVRPRLGVYEAGIGEEGSGHCRAI